MNTFSLKRIPEIIGNVRFYYLLFNGRNYYREFEEQIMSEGSYEKELNTIQAILMQVSEVKKPLPKEKFRVVTNEKDPLKGYEAKSRNLRVLLFKQSNKGYILVSGFKKGRHQKKK